MRLLREGHDAEFKRLDKYLMETSSCMLAEPLTVCAASFNATSRVRPTIGPIFRARGHVRSSMNSCGVLAITRADHSTAGKGGAGRSGAGRVGDGRGLMGEMGRVAWGWVRTRADAGVGEGLDEEEDVGRPAPREGRHGVHVLLRHLSRREPAGRV